MPERDLRINLIFVKQAAERAARDFHEGERERIRGTANEQARAEKQYSDQFKKRRATFKAWHDETVRDTKNLERETQESQKRTDALRKKANQQHLRDLQQLVQESRKASAQMADGAIREAKRVAAEENKLFRAKMALSDAVWKAEQAHVARYMGQMDRSRKEQSQKLRESLSADGAARQRANDQWARDEREINEKSVESTKSLFRQRLGAAVAEAKERSAMSRRLTDESIALTKKADEAEKNGKTGLAEIYRRHAAEKIEMAKVEAKGSADAAKRGAAAVVEASKGEGVAVREVNRGIVESAKETAQSTAKYAREGFKQVTKASGDAASAQQDATKKTTGAIQEQQAKIREISDAYTKMRILAEVQQAVRLVIDATTESLANSKDHIRQMVEEMEEYREKLAEILAMKGMPQTAGATAEELGLYAKAGVTPSQGIEAASEFQAQMAGMVQPRVLAAGQKAESYRLDNAMSERLQENAMGLAAANGMDQKSAVRLLGVLASKAATGKDGKIDEQAVKNTFAQNFGLLQKAKGHTDEDARQFAVAAQKLAGEGGVTADINELAVLFAAQAEIDPTRSRVHMDALFRALEQLDDEKREKLGIKAGMNSLQQLEAARKAIPEIAKREFGGDERVAARRSGFDDQRELDAFMADLNAGVRGGVYARVRGEQGAMNAAKAQQQIEEYKKSPRGIKARQASESARISAIQAAPHEALTAMRREAENTTKESGILNEPESAGAAVVTKMGKALNLGDRAQQERERLLILNITRGLEQYPEGRAWLKVHGRLSVWTPENVLEEAAGVLAQLRKTGTPDNGMGPDIRVPGEQAGHKERLTPIFTIPGLFSVPTSARAAGRLAGGGTMVRPSSVVASAIAASRSVGRRSSVGANARRRGIGQNWNDAIISGGAAPIEILTDAEKAAREKRLAASRARTAAGLSATPGTRAFAAAHAGESEFQRAAREHIEANHRYLAERHAAANPSAPPPVPTPQSPDYGFGHGKFARAAEWPLLVARSRMGLAASRANYENEGRSHPSGPWRSGVPQIAPPPPPPYVYHSHINADRSATYGQGRKEDAIVGSLKEALRQGSRPPVPPATPSRPHVIQN